MSNRKLSNQRTTGFFIAIGAGVGTAIGVATKNVAICLGIGITIGMLLSIIWIKR